MLSDILALLLPLLAPFALGLPVVWLVRGRAALRATDWLLAPFLGWAALALVLQNLVYLDVPVSRATPWVWAACGALWIWCLRRGEVGASWRARPRAALLVALCCYALQGAALLRVGPQHWVGRLWEDQFGYTTMAQFFRDEPYSTQVADMGQRAYLFRVLRPSMGRFALPITLKENRIGQSMLQAFLASTLRRDTKPLFGPLIVSGAPLLVLGMVLLAGRLGLPPPVSLLAGALAALLPGLTLLQLENFLSHSLVLGFFATWLVVLDELGERPAFGAHVAAALVLSFGVSDYCEMWAALLGLAIVVLGTRGLEQRRPLLAARSWGLVVLLSLALNPGFVPRLFLFMQLATTEDLHAAIYPWAQALEGLARLWLGDLARAVARPLWAPAADLFGLLATFAGGCGLLLLLRPSPQRPSRALALGAVALAAGALPLRLAGQHPYQFYKTLLTGAPALALGLAALGVTWRHPRRRLAARAGAWIALVAAAAATLEMVASTSRAGPAARSNARVLLDPDVRTLAAQLEHLQGQDLVLGPSLPPMLNSWLTYFARGNDVWLATPFLSRDRLHESDAATTLLDLVRAPPDALVLTQRATPPGPTPAARRLWSNAAYELWQPAPGHWATVFDQDGGPGSAFELALRPVTLHVLAGQAGTAQVTLARQDAGAEVTILLHVRSRQHEQTQRVELPAVPDGGQAPVRFDVRVELGYNELRWERVRGPAPRLDAQVALR